jgi:hypothetical protein
VVKNTWCGVDEGKKHGVKLENASILMHFQVLPHVFFNMCTVQQQEEKIGFRVCSGRSK